MTPDVVVIGGGIIGALSALEIAKSGAKVTLLEKNKFGHGASGNSAAMLELQLDAYRGEPFYSLAKASHDMFPAVSKELRARSGMDIQFARCSIMQVALNDGEADFLEKECARQRNAGMDATWISPSEVNSRLPGFTKNQKGAALFSHDGQVHGGYFLEAALKSAELAGVQLKENVKDAVIEEALRHAPKVVMAAGAWTDEVLKPLGVRLGVTPIRGQLMVFETTFPVLPFPVYTKSGGYLTPKGDGTTLAGTTIEQVGFDLSPTEEGRNKITEIVRGLMPDLLSHPFKKMTAGLRPRSPDDLPLIGPLPDDPRVIVAVGHYRNGILLAPVTAKIVAALAQGQSSPLPLDSFLPSRISLGA